MDKLFRVGLILAAVVSVTYGQAVKFNSLFYATDAGGDVTMECLTATGKTLDGFYLPDGTKAVATPSRYRVTEGTTPGGDGMTTHTLVILSVVEGDHGDYECRTSETDIARVTLVIRVTVTLLENQNLALGEDGVIAATVAGYPRPKTISWFKKTSIPDSPKFLALVLSNGTVSADGNRYHVAVHGALTIKNVKADDAGDYTLTVPTGAGSTSNKPVTIKVGAKPTYAKKPEAKYTVTKGETLSIPCELTGANAAPTWTHNTTAGVVSTVLSVGRITVRPTVLEITVAERADEGDYVCSGSNDYGTATATASLTHVIDPPTVAIADVDPLVEGKSANLTCTGTGYPLPTVTWSKLNGNAHSPVAGQKASPGSSVIMLPSIQLSDSGQYMCEADNGAVISGTPKIASTSANYTVNSPPKVTVANDKLTFVLVKNEAKKVECTASGYPTPDVELMFNGVALPDVVKTTSPSQSSDKLPMVVASLNYTVSKDANLGTISCVATNAEGSATANVTIEKIKKPQAPESPQVTSKTNTSLTISWQVPPSSSTPTSYKVRVAIGPKVIKMLPSTTKSLTVDNLKNGTEYNISVQAINDAGSSNFSESTRAETEKLVKPNKPVLNTVSTDFPSTEATFDWSAPVGSTGPLSYLVILCRFNVVLDKYDFCDDGVTQTETTWTKDKLQPNMRYKFTVIAKNVQGSSPSVEQLFTTGPSPKPVAKKSGLSSGALVGIIIVILLIIFIIVDLCCCFFNNCGFSHCCFESCCSGRKGKYAAAEVGEEVMMDRKATV